MSVESWKKEFMPMRARGDLSPLATLKRDKLKWDGLKKENLKKHNVVWDGYSVIGADGLKFTFGGKACCCCKHEKNKNNNGYCPLYSNHCFGMCIEEWCNRVHDSGESMRALMDKRIKALEASKRNGGKKISD